MLVTVDGEQMIVGPLHACVKNSWWWSEEDNAWNLGLHKTSGCHGDTVNEAGGNCGRDKDGVGCFDSRNTTLAFKT